MTKEEDQRVRVRKIVRSGDEQKVFIPRLVVDKTIKFLQQLGNEGKEGRVFWGGVEAPFGPIYVTTCFIPGISKASLGSVTVDTSEGAKVVSEARKRGLEIVAQVHSHPGGAFHSCTDDEYAFSYSKRFLSIVVPNFGKDGMEPLTKCCIVSYEGQGKWQRHSLEEIRRNFVIVDFEVFLG